MKDLMINATYYVTIDRNKFIIRQGQRVRIMVMLVMAPSILKNMTENKINIDQ